MGSVVCFYPVESVELSSQPGCAYCEPDHKLCRKKKSENEWASQCHSCYVFDRGHHCDRS